MENLLREFYELNNQRKDLEKKLKVLKASIIEDLNRSENKTAVYGGYWAGLKPQSRSILDQEALKEVLGVARFESFKKTTDYEKLDVIKQS